MLTQVEIISPRFTVAQLPLAAGGSEVTDPVQILDIKGLGPVNADIKTSKFGALDGEFYTDSTVATRNIVVTFGLNPNWTTTTYEGLRAQLYLYLMPKSFVRLRFTSTHLPVCEITGYVETFEDNMFSKDPQVVVSILCPKPYFEDVTETVLTGTTLALSDSSMPNLTYTGTIEAGYILDIERSTTDFSGQIQVSNFAPRNELFSINPVGITVDYFLRINTKTGEKSVMKKYYSKLASVSQLGFVPANSKWPLLKPGANSFKVMGSGVGYPWTLRYKNKYGGL